MEAPSDAAVDRRTWVLVALMLWAAGSFGLAIARGLAGWRGRADFRPPAFDWRFGTPRVAGMASCLAGVNEHVPRGSRVALFDPRWDGFYRWRWAAYLLVADDLVLADTPEAEEASYLVAMGDDDPPRGTFMVGGPGCRLYRLR